MKKCSKCKKDKEQSNFYRNRSTKDGLGHQCKLCVGESNKQWALKNPSNQKKRSKKHYQNNTEKYKKWGLNRKKKDLKTKYDLTLEQAEEIYSRGCQICGTTEKLCIDHCHSTGKVRGCLCFKCNLRLGNYEKLLEDQYYFYRLQKYLEDNN